MATAFFISPHPVNYMAVNEKTNVVLAVDTSMFSSSYLRRGF